MDEKRQASSKKELTIGIYEVELTAMGEKWWKTMIDNDDGQGMIDEGEWMIDDRERAIDNGQWSIDNRQQSTDNGWLTTDDWWLMMDNAQQVCDNWERGITKTQMMLSWHEGH
jgi:hypothetical protein